MPVQKLLHIQLLQMAIHWHDAEANCKQIEMRLSDQPDADIIVLPEMFNSGFSMQPDKVAESMEGYTVKWMHQLAKAKNSVIVGSVAIREEEHCFNRMIWMEPSGAVQFYDKKHLFAMAGEDDRYTAGNKRVVVKYRGWNILLQVCYDLRFPGWCRQQSLDYDLMILVANWPDARANAWNGLIPARAIENQAYVAAVNRVGDDARGLNYAGDTQLIDYLGKTLANANAEESVLNFKLDFSLLCKSRMELPFQHDADRITIE
jgi:predicted amidohydrolase